MIKIKNISKEILAKHKNYISESRMFERIEDIKKNEDILNLFDNSNFSYEHNKFCDYMKNQVEKLRLDLLDDNIKDKNIFLANVHDLNNIIKYVEKNFPVLSQVFKTKDPNSEKYRKEILKAIGYSEFSNKEIDKFFRMEFDFYNKYNNTFIKNRLKQIKSKKQRRYTIKEYKIFESEIMIDIDFIQSINIKNNGIDTKLNILKSEIRDVSVNSSTLKEYILSIQKILNNWIKNYDEDVININNYKNYLNRTENLKVQWSAYNFVLELGIKVCPYCNRQYITPVYSESGKLRGDLDHFYAKSKFPYLSMSIYNLVPCCKFCNSSLKGDKEFTYERNINPYEDGIDDYMYFSYIPNSIKSFYGNDSIIIKLFEKENADKEMLEKLKNNLKLFQIENLYQYNTNIVELLLKKRTIFTDKYLDNFYNNHKNVFESKTEMIDMLFRDSLQFEEDSPFSKLKKDIISEIIYDKHKKVK
ncbi:MAG: hypothetical protein E6980_06900 [Clostridium sp.]|uniref:hypothetical protein n=1 Tax=Clostridium sp. TaxID=1506 RepID=UPI0029013944|nr:hypothetical protein [Clostridium sp.]MDU1229876.1 hypothetical protein [Clostridium sp.]